MKKRLFILMLAYLVVFQTIITPISASTAYAVSGNEEFESTEELDEHVEKEAVKDVIKGIYYTDKDNTKVKVDEHEGEILIHVNWSAQNKENLPEYEESFTIPGHIQLNELTGDLKVKDVNFAKYKANNNGEINIEFNEDLEALEEIEGTLTFKGEIKTEKETDQVEEEVAEEVTEEKEETKQAKEDLVKVEKNLQASQEPKAITENIIDQMKLMHKDGTEFESGELIEINEDLRFELDWSLPNGHDFVAGDYFEFELPKQLTVHNEIKNSDLGGYGTINVDLNGNVKFTFNEKIEQESNIKGTFWFDTILKESTITSTEETIELVINGEVVETVIVNVKPKGGQAIAKEGQPVDGNFNTEEVEWTVIINTTRDSLKNAIIKDPILAGQELILDSLVLTEVEVDLTGKVIQELGEVIGFENNSSLDNLNIKLGDTNKAYKLTFKTKLLEKDFKEGTTNYKNDATLKSDGKKDAQAGGSVSVSRPKSMEKTSSAFDKGDRSIEWTVNANFTEQQLNKGDVITDEFTFTVGKEEVNDVFEIKQANIEILQVDKFDDKGKPTETSDAKDLFDITIEGNKVTYKLKDASNKAFILKYKTELKDGAYINKDGKITNKIDLNGKTATGSQGVYQQVGKKTNAGINYKDKTIDWTITVNADKQDLRNFVLTDSFAGTGQKLVEDSIEITPAGNSATITPNTDNEGFKINFGNITDTYTIKYQTKFTYDFDGKGTPNFKNGVKITYETSDGSDYELGFGNEVKPNKETKSNGAKNGSANNETKEITWKVDVNYNQLALTDAKLTDTIPDNQSLIDGSVKIYETSIADKGGITVGNNVTDKFTVDANENQVNVDFGAIDKSYRVEFKTKDKDGIYNSDEVYENTAQFIPRENEVHNLTAKVTLPNQGQFLGKTGTHNKEDWTIDWKIDVNKSQSTTSDFTITDDLGDTAAQILLEDTIKITKAGSTEELVEGKDYELTIEGNKFKIYIPGEITEAYVVTYSSYIVAEETVDVTNEAEIQSNDVIKGTTDKTETVKIKISTGGGTGEGTTGSLVLDKFETGSERKLSDVPFKLIKTIGNKEIVVREGTTDENGKLEWKGLKFDKYTLKEEIPKGYLGEAEREVELSSKDPKGIKTLSIENTRETGTARIIKVDAVTGETLPDAKFTLENQTTKQNYTFKTDNDGVILENVPHGEYTVKEITAPGGYRITKDIPNITVEIGKTATIEVKNIAFVDVSGQKTWFTDKKLPKEITVELLANGKKVDQQTVTKDNNWKYSFKNLDKYNKADQEIKYEINEVNVDGYISVKEGYDLTNIQTIDIPGSKTWVDDHNATGDRPNSIVVQLLNGKEVVQEQVVSGGKENIWTYEFTNIPKYDSKGIEINYSVNELEVDGYKSVVSGFNIDNIRVGKTSVKGEKIWKDEDPTDRPNSIEVNLTREVKGELDKEYSETKTVKPNAKGEWTYKFDDLDEFNENGAAYTYMIKEENVPKNYVSSVEGHDITNVRIGETEVSGTKRWKDDNVKDRPDSIKVNLLRNNVVVETKDVTAEDDWEYSFTKLAKYDEDGKYYKYTVKEEQVPGYAPKVKGNDITNTRSEKTNIEITKGWLDDNSKERPSEIIVYLYQNDKLFDTLEVASENDWVLEVPNLEAYDEDGQPYSYTIKEKAIPGYKSKVDGFNITNLRVGKTEVSGTKTWKDNNDATGDRPESITVELVQNGKPTGKTEIVTADKDGNWKYSFKDLDKYDEEGRAYTYEIKEQAIKGYESKINDYNLENLRVGKTEVFGEKIWMDNNDATGDRPDEITVNLLQNGQIFATETITAEQNWTYSFKDLPRFDENGAEWGYTIDEEFVEGYEKSVDNYNLINTRVGEREITIEKIWIDENQSDRPEDIAVNLLQNGTLFTTETIKPDKDGNWSHTFKALPEFDSEGKAYAYTVTEHDVAGYDSVVDGFEITNTRAEEKSIEITKAWLDDDSKERPESIEVELFRSIADGEKEAVETYTVTAENDWSLEITGLPAFNPNGKAYTYEIEEKAVENYETEINGFDITNLRVGETTVEGTKFWKGDQEENRPEKITVKLFANEEEVDSQTVTADSNWEYAFTNLPKYDEKGKLISYTVDEVAVKDYKTSIDGYEITNTFIPDEPTEPKPVDPTKPGKENPTKPDTGETDKPSKPGESVTPNEEGKAGSGLPATATDIFNLILIGLIMLLVGGALFIVRKKRTN